MPSLWNEGGGGFLGRRKGKVERGAAVWRALSPHSARMLGDNAAHNAQANAFPLVLGVESLEGKEELFGYGLFEANSIVTHLENYFLIRGLRPKFDDGLPILPGVNPGIRE